MSSSCTELGSFSKSALLKQISLWKGQVGSWPCQAFGILSWVGNRRKGSK